ncbi:Cu(+)/Ag(+) sensor histidine kinase [Pollutimonas harenae]|uniref:Sensor protein n=1 Tax=Pollutimonas harenae TaxID=657015 RepID=A0A853H209_9BURK|nr:Cu(+)/Ag(+) sensor histidine kinase [Pollutimonas harenae]NYT85275.1 Cu(+)/Ag(+) sensor histidine kinase [Pollutimonas harenae]TEA72360.1 heavy metal sensor histidine kinase [Pollutimonas harenae]
MKRRPASLAVRLTVSIGTVITVVLLSFGWVIERSINDHFIQQDVDELNAVVQALKHTLATLPPNDSSEALRGRLANAVSGHHNAQYRISTANGAVIYATPGSDLARFATIAQPVEQITIGTVGIWQDHGETFRGAVLRIAPDGLPGMAPLTIAVATGINFHLHYLESFRDYLRLITVFACLIAILATWLAVHQGHAPIRRISREIRSIRSDQLHIRLAADAVPTELVELATSFNQMLDRLEDVFKRLSDFSGDIAHELRTPITNIKTQTEVALSQARDVEQYREILYSNLEEYERMAKMVGDMLFLAQADNNLLKPELVTIDLDVEIRVLFDYFGAWAEERGVALELAGERVCMSGDRLMIRRALSNLLSNAIRYTPTGETVDVSLQATGDVVKVRIQNPGPVIPAEHLPHIFERFYRPDASRQRNGEGAGLGLAIAKSIIEAHGGQIIVSSTAQWTTFEIISPASSL